MRSFFQCSSDKPRLIEQDVPLLISSKVLRSLKTVVDFGKDAYHFGALGADVGMVHTDTGHIGFKILCGEGYMMGCLMKLDWTAFAESNHEVAFGRCRQDRVDMWIPPTMPEGLLKVGC